MIKIIAILVAINLSLRITSCNIGRKSMKNSIYREGGTLRDVERVESYQGRVGMYVQNEQKYGTIDWNMKDGNMYNRLHGWHMKVGTRIKTSQKVVSVHKTEMNKNSQEESWSSGWSMRDGNGKEISQKEVFTNEVELSWNITTRMKNKKIKITNGNRDRALNLVHWNAGATQWPRKVSEIRQLICEFKPDIIAISEANLMSDTPEYKSQIQGYTMVQTNTMNTMRHCRLIMLVKDEMDIEILGNIMEQDLATIWIRD